MPSAEPPFLGILQLDTRFPRIPGDAGNIHSYPFPAKTLTVPHADVPQVVSACPPPRKLVTAFIAAAQQLESEGAFALISTCGFLVHVQAELAHSVSIPVRLSALCDYPRLQQKTGAAPIAIFTASSRALSTKTLAKAHIPPEAVEIIGMEQCTAFRNAILQHKTQQNTELDTAAIQAYCHTEAKKLIARRPDIGAILLECGNLPPYADSLHAATGLPVHSILDTAHRLAARRSTACNASS